MNKIITIIFLIFMATISYSADFGAPTGKTVNVAFPPENYITIFSAQPGATTGDSTIKDIGFTPKEVKCYVTNGGTAPTNFVMAFYTGPDSSNMYLAYPTGTTSTTVTSFPSGISFINGYGDRYWKVNFTSMSGGDGTTTLTVKCTGSK